MKNTRTPVHLFVRAGLVLAGIAPWTAAHGQSVRFRTEGRLVEVYATIFDHKGRYIDDLTRDRFQVAEDGKPQSIVAFENNATALSCTILLDTTGSMTRALPAVKNAVLKLLNEMRDSDRVAIYSFNENLKLLQDFTADKKEAKRAVLRTRPQGGTALFDAIAEVARELRGRSGKKAIIVFTDGNDNASALNPQAAMARARRTGVPVYTIAEGDALQTQNLMAHLRKLADLSGGISFEAGTSSDIDRIFARISVDLRHTYLVTYKPVPLSEAGAWRRIELTVSGLKDYHVRSKEGYVAE